MFKIPLPEIINKLQQHSGFDKQEIIVKIKQKMDELSGLVSEEGAAHILANEMGVKLISGLESSRLSITNIIPGLMNVSIIGRVINQSEVKEWSRGERSGKIASLLLGDDTGKIRLVLWNETADILKNNNLTGKIIQIKYAVAKESNGFGSNGVELHTKSTSKIELEPEHPDTTKIPLFDDEISNLKQNNESKPSFSYIRKDIIESSENELNEFRAVIVQVFDRIVFFEVCPECRKRARKEENMWCCGEHKFQTPVYSMVVNAVVDDGTDTIRCSFFGNQAENLINMDVNSARAKFPEKITSEFINSLIGKEILVSGKINYNAQFDRKELQIRNISLPDYIKEAELLLN
ncbi:MAG: DUF2240 family protein [Candidatus Nanoarchaeia archaeon]|nr:DUF2240 family protein [Candidatus Nanoarchaeia archaeon]